MDWAERMAAPDAAIDEELGDEIEFAVNGANYLPIKAWAFPAGVEQEGSFGMLDPIVGVNRVKVAKRIIELPTMAMRFKVPQFADPEVTHWRPANWVKVSSGRYWLIDLQKAVT